MSPVRGHGSPAWTREEAERYLLSLELFGMRFGLDRMRRLMTALAHPERQFESIHVVRFDGSGLVSELRRYWDLHEVLRDHGLTAL